MIFKWMVLSTSHIDPITFKELAGCCTSGVTTPLVFWRMTWDLEK